MDSVRARMQRLFLSPAGIDSFPFCINGLKQTKEYSKLHLLLLTKHDLTSGMEYGHLHL